jgi:hypothetical protein
MSDRPPVRIVDGPTRAVPIRSNGETDAQLEEALKRARCAEKKYKNQLSAIGSAMLALREILGMLFECPIQLNIEDGKMVLEGDGQKLSLEEAVHTVKTLMKEAAVKPPLRTIPEEEEPPTDLSSRVLWLEDRLTEIALDFYPKEHPRRKQFEE